MTTEPAKVVPLHPVHPAANVFRLMTEDEVAELAEDIRANGLHDPIVLDRDGKVIDGRNRLTACVVAGVRPAFTTYDGDDVEAFVWSRGGLRRNVSAGMRAMALAMLYPDGAKLKRAGSGKSRDRDFTKAEINGLSQARKVLRLLPQLATQVRDGSVTLADAYTRAQVLEMEIAAASKTDADLAAEQITRLRSFDPTLAEDVEEGRRTLDAATARMTEIVEGRRLRAQAKVERAASICALVQSLKAEMEIYADAIATNRDLFGSHAVRASYEEFRQALGEAPSLLEELLARLTAEEKPK